MMFEAGDLVGLFVSGGWGESVLSESRGVVISCDLISNIATVVWASGYQGTEFFEDLKLIAYGRKND